MLKSAMLLWHLVLESLGYFVAFRLYLRERRRSSDFLGSETRWTIIAAAMIGAAAGSKLLYWLEDPMRTVHQWNDLAYLMAGKTIVGALLGGTIAVEVTKARLGIRERTGDLFAIPLTVGIAIGRVGCFLAGTQDGTYGVATSLPWAVDFGDGVRRHPV
ncbi:MAG TPA: prolipoprotein diacylglyceryl transferase family protein [Bryobacteraceae bacterium]|nr:prolipoprotein diacylglyceryl transferase family protein [Bryobacteraceae bacterium]